MSGLFGSSGSPPPPPPPKPVAPMPDENSPAVLEATRMQQTKVLNRIGRRNTILSGEDTTDSAAPYSAKTLSG